MSASNNSDKHARSLEGAKKVHRLSDDDIMFLLSKYEGGDWDSLEVIRFLDAKFKKK